MINPATNYILIRASNMTLINVWLAADGLSLAIATIPGKEIFTAPNFMTLS
jgi:hypothetical protein